MIEWLKQRWASKTYRLGIGTVVLGMLESAQASGLLPELLPPSMGGPVVIGIGVAIFILRELTTGPIGNANPR